jgi:hypothetical protein
MNCERQKFNSVCRMSFLQVFRSIQDRLKAVVSRGDLRSVYHEQSVKSEVLQILDCLCSVADAARSDNITLIFGFLYPMSVDAVALLGMYCSFILCINQLQCL